MERFSICLCQSHLRFKVIYHNILIWVRSGLWLGHITTFILYGFFYPSVAGLFWGGGLTIDFRAAQSVIISVSMHALFILQRTIGVQQLLAIYSKCYKLSFYMLMVYLEKRRKSVHIATDVITVIFIITQGFLILCRVNCLDG